jgi:ribosomal protein L24E
MECAYCGDEIDRTAGKVLIQNSGNKVYFCSGKCQTNWEQDRSHEYRDS